MRDEGQETKRQGDQKSANHQHHHQPDRVGGVAEKQIGHQLQAAAQVVIGASMPARFVPHWNVGVAGRIGEQHRRDVGKDSSHVASAIDHGPAGGTEAGQLKTGRQFENAAQGHVNDLSAPVSKNGMFLAVVGANGQVESPLYGVHQFGDFFRWILQIIIHGNDDLTVRQIEATQGCVMLAAVDQQSRDPQVGAMRGLELFQNAPALIATAIIHQHDFISRVQSVQDFTEAGHQPWQRRFGVVNEDDNAELRGHEADGRLSIQRRCSGIFNDVRYFRIGE